MGHVLLSFLVQLELFAVASAAKLLPPITRAEDGTFAGAQHPQPTAAPGYYASAELLKRDGYTMDHDTCGFGALNSAATYACYSSIGTCEDIGNFRGCCTGGLKACSSTFWTQCDDYDPRGVCSVKTRCCQSGAPYCISWLFSTSGSTLTAFDCDVQSKTRTFELLATPLSLIDSTTSTTDDSTTVSPTRFPTQEDTTLSSGKIQDSTATVSKSTATTSPSGTSSSAPDNGSENHVGAIVGGVVGGVAVIGLIVLGVFFIKKYQRSASTTIPLPPTSSGAMRQPKTQIPTAQTSPIVEAPNTPATGTGNNRAELAGCVEVHRYEI